MVYVKICGLNDEESYKTAVTYHADFVGFVFVEKSPRYVTINRVSEIVASLPKYHTKLVALSVNADIDFITTIIQKIPDIDYIQCHGSETPKQCQYIKDITGKKIIKAITIDSHEDFQQWDNYRDMCDIILCDAKPPQNSNITGGHGIPIDWTLFHDRKLSDNWMLAGGLNPDNVQEAIAETHAPMIDVSSGVETMPGQKSPDKIIKLLDLVHHLTI